MPRKKKTNEPVVQLKVADIETQSIEPLITEKKVNDIVRGACDGILEFINKPISINWKKVDPKTVIPSYAHEGDIGMDVTCTSVEWDEKTDTYIYHTGLACESLESGVACFALPRSSNYKTEAYLTNSVGLIDPVTYRGEIQWRYKNRTSTYLLVQEMVMEKFIMSPWYKKITLKQRNKLMNSIRYGIDPKSVAFQYKPYEVGDRIGQFVFVRTDKTVSEEVQELTETERGSGGFGSTGK